MIRNKLTKIEFHKILSSIFNLNGYDKIRTSLFELLYYKPLSPVGDHTPTINLKSTGVKTTYRGFDIEITSLVEFGIVIKLTKKQTMLDGFFNSPSYSLSNEIIRYFEKSKSRF